MRELGFAIVRCGPDGPSAWAIAQDWNERWQRVRRGETPGPAFVPSKKQSLEAIESAIVYPKGSLGEAFKRYRSTDEWREKKPRTREDWWRGWKRIKPYFADQRPTDVTLEFISSWRSGIEKTAGLREAHRAMKIWRALWKVAAAMHYCDRDKDPSLGVRNRAAAGRSLTWSEGEVARLYKRAWREGYIGLSAVIAVAWSTQLSPVDVRTLRASQVASDGSGTTFFTERGKTGTPIGGGLSARAVAALGAYLGKLGVEMHGDALIFRNRSGAPYSKDTLGDDFRTVKRLEFGDGEKRTLADFRRSGAVEAIAGGAKAEELAHAMGNTLGASNTLYKTYVPINMGTIRAVADARRKGRNALRGRNRP